MKNGSIYFPSHAEWCKQNVCPPSKSAKRTSRKVHSFRAILTGFGFKKKEERRRSRCAAEFLPSHQIIQVSDVWPPAAPHKTCDLLVMRSYQVSEQILGGVTELFVFLWRRDNSAASLNCSWQPAVSAFSAAPPSNFFSVSLRLLLNREKLHAMMLWMECRAGFLFLFTLIHYVVFFASKPHQVKSEFNSVLYEQHFFF